MKKIITTITLITISVIMFSQQGMDNNFLTTNSTTGDFSITNVFKLDNNATNQNLCVGYMAGQALVSGDGIRNTVFGQIAGDALTTGDYNCIFGRNAGGASTAGVGNCLFGASSGAGLTTSGGQYNNFFGYESGLKTTTGNNNVFIGRVSGYENLTGTQNVYIGNFSGQNATGTANVFIGYLSGANETGSNKLYIDNSNTATPLLYGDFAGDSVNVNGKLSSNYFIASCATKDSVVTTTSAGTYYIFSGWRDTAAVNTTVTDSTITIASNGSGYYTIYCGFSFTYVANQTIHFSLFVNDVEAVDFAEAERKLGTNNDVGVAGFNSILYLNNNDVLKIKVNGTSAGGTFTANHGQFNVVRIN